MFDVNRYFGVDYIIFDILFALLFLFLLYRNKHRVAFWAYFAGGLGINMMVDWGFWLHTGIREIVLPTSFLPFISSFDLRVFIFFFWFSLTYGVEYAYTFVMFKKDSNKLFWTLLVFFGWILVALLSQSLHIYDDQITTIRHMADTRLIRLGLVVLGYGILLLLKYPIKKIAYLFAVGFSIHFMMEFALYITGIRPTSLLILVENSLIEFNMGVPFFFLLWDRWLKKFEKNSPIKENISLASL